MARTIAEIYEAIVIEKDNQTSLQSLAPQADSLESFKQDLNSTSKVANWRLFAYLIAVAHWTHEKLWQLFKVELQLMIDAAPTGTTRWYQEQVLAYQYGDNLTYIDNKYIYPTIDETKQIIKLCSVTERPDSVLVVKAAKLDSSQQPIPLDAQEQAALLGFLQKMKFAGTRLAVVSDTADLLKVVANVYYDPIFPSAIVKTNVEIAVNEYIKNLPFDGVFKITHLIDAIQAVEGVTDFVYTAMEAKYGALAYQPIVRIYNANAGYLAIDGSMPLSNTLTYIPSIN